MSVLALDLATFMGLAFRDDEGIVTRAIDLVAMAGIPKSHQSREHGKLFMALDRLLVDFLNEFELIGKISAISIEDDTGRNKKTSALLAGYRAVVKLRAARLGIRVIDHIKASDARAAAGVGGGGTDKATAVANARRFYGLQGCEDEVDAAVLLIATEHWLKAEEFAAEVKTLSRKTKRRNAA